jgi:Ulp1 family protease
MSIETDSARKIPYCKFDLNLSDILRLKPGQTTYSWLNGKIIDAYMEFLTINYTHVKILSLSLITYYWDHHSLPRRINLPWINGFDGLLFVPIHLPDHWGLLVADFKNKTITTMDSLNRDHINDRTIMFFVRNFRYM